MKRLALIFSVFIFFVFFLHQVFSGRIVLPQSFLLGPITIHYYGLVVALAAASGFYLALKRASAYGIDKKKAEDLIFWIIIAGFIGARVYHVLLDFDYYSVRPAEIIKVWQGGLSINGAVIGGLFGLWIYKKLTAYPPDFATTKSLRAGNLQLTIILNWLTPSILVGQIIGRFGNLFNYEAFGYPTNLPWKLFVPPQFRPEQYQNLNFFHPWFLYEILGNALFLIFIFVFRKDKAPGLFLWYLLWYNSIRFGLEFFRTDSVFAYGIRLNVISSLILAMTAVVLLHYLKRAQKFINDKTS